MGLVPSDSSAARPMLARLLDVTKRRIFPPVILAAIAVTVVYVWFGGHQFIYFVDDIWPFSPARDISSYAVSWNSLFNGGLSNPDSLSLLPVFYFASGLTSLGVSSSAAEFVYLSLAISAGMIGAYYCCRLIVGSSGTGVFVSIVVALLYAFNPVTVMIVIPDGVPFGPLLLGVFPWAYYLTRITFDRVSGKRAGSWTASAVLMCLTYAGILSVNEPSGANLLPLVLTLPLISYPWHKRELSRSKGRMQLKFIGISACSVGISLLLNAWWLLPEYAYVLPLPFLHIAPVNSAFFELNLSHSIWVSSTSSATLFGVLVEAGFPNWGWQSVNSLYFATTSWETIGISLPIVAFLGGILIRDRGAKAEWIYHASVVLALILILTGVNSPASSIVSLTVSSPIAATLFRDPWYSFYSAFVLYYAILFGTGLNEIALRLKYNTNHGSTPSGEPNRKGIRKWMLNRAPRVVVVFTAIACVVLLVGVYPAPAWNGGLIPSQPASGDVSVPNYVYQTADFLRANSQGYSALILPSSGIACQEISNWSGGYVGTSILALASGIPTIYNSCTDSGPSEVLGEVYDLSYSNLTDTNFSGLLSTLNVKYVIDRFDAGGPISYYPTPNPAHVDWFLRHQSGIQYVTTFGKYEVFENLNALPPVFSSSELISENELNYSLNLTQAFYNRSIDTIGPGGIGNLAPDWRDGGIALSFKSDNYTGGPLFAMNSVPLGIDSSIFPRLTVNLTSQNQVAVSIMVSSYPILPGNANFWGTMLPLAALAPASTMPNSGNLEIYQFRGSISLHFDLTELQISDSLYPLGVPLGNLSFLAVALWHVTNGVPDSWSTGIPLNYSVEIDSIQLAGNSFPFAEENVVKPQQSFPFGADTVNVTNLYFGNSGTGANLSGSMIWNRGELGYELGRYNTSANDYAVSMNTHPLDINTSQFPYLVINATLSPNTSIVVFASSAASLNSSSLWSGDPVPLQINNQLALPVSDQWPYYYVPTSSFPLTFDLSALRVTDSHYPTSSSLKVLNYLAVLLVPLANDTPLAGAVPPGIVPTIQIRSMQSYSRILSVAPVGIPAASLVAFADPLSVIYTNETLQSNARLVQPRISSVSYDGQSTYSVELELPSEGPFVITLAQNYGPLWEFCVDGDCAVQGIIHFLGDGYANSWLIHSGTLLPGHNYSITLFYEGQTIVNTGTILSWAGLVFLSVFAVYQVVFRSKRRR